MATKVTSHLVDDLDGSQASQSVRFSLDGVEYETDLNDEHAQELRSAFEGYVAAARRTGGRKSAGRSSGRNSNASEIREWAKAQGIEISDRGRIPAELREQYKNR